MVGRERPGPSPLTTQRVEFGRLIASGVTNSEACRLVGVNRRTGADSAVEHGAKGGRRAEAGAVGDHLDP